MVWSCSAVAAPGTMGHAVEAGPERIRCHLGDWFPAAETY